MSTPLRRATASGTESRWRAARTSLHRWVEAAGARLLVVDPDDDGGALAERMAGHGIHVTWVGTTLDALVAFGRTDPHAVLVAPECPGVTPVDFVHLIRSHGTPYVMAAAGAGSGPLVMAGAALVVPRPYDAQRVWEAMCQGPRSVADHALVEAGAIELDAASFTVRVRGERIADLPLKEFELLRALLIAAPGMVTDDELRDALWGDSGRRPGGNTIAMHVTRLRARLGDAALVRRIRGRGYTLTPM